MNQPDVRLLSPASCRHSSRCLLFISSSSHVVPPRGVNSSASRLRLRPPRTRRSAPSAPASPGHAHSETRCSPTPKDSRASGFRNKTTTGREPFKQNLLQTLTFTQTWFWWLLLRYHLKLSPWPHLMVTPEELRRECEAFPPTVQGRIRLILRVHVCVCACLLGLGSVN